MRKIFADTNYWIALLNPKDELHHKAKYISAELGSHFTVTSEMVLTELLNDFAKRGEYFRNIAASLTHQLQSAPNCEVVPQTSILFRDAVGLYANRIDKTWSLTDCASFIIMKERQVTEALTHDVHFVQASFRALLRNED